MGQAAEGGHLNELISFDGFRVDLRSGRLMRGREAVPLRRKTWEVLLYMLHRAGELISRDEFLDAVWSDAAVTPDTLSKSIGELRAALGDDSRSPRYIATVHRRGFRFLPLVTTEAVSQDAARPALREVNGRGVTPGTRCFVGRHRELDALARALASAHRGERQVVLLKGAAGVGKTALIDTFLESAVGLDGPPVVIARGDCIDQYGPREPYMPFLEALARVARQLEVSEFLPLLRRVAPTWLAQMPWLTDLAERNELQQSPGSHGPECMMREFAELVEAVAAERTILVALEDLHWSDPSTINLLSALAQRREAARLLVIGTYRPGDVLTDNPLSTAARTLRLRHHCVEVPVAELSEEEVRLYLDERFPGAQFNPVLAARLYRDTGGNPLFLGAVIESLRVRGLILATEPGWELATPFDRIELGVPEDVGDAIAAQVDTLMPADRALLEAASIVGVDFGVSAVAGVLDTDERTVEGRCEALARTGRFLRATDGRDWPSDDESRLYAFPHDLYRRAVYAGIPDWRRRDMHQRLAETLEKTRAESADQIAALLASHFEDGGDSRRAIKYLIRAGARARQRFAYREATECLQPALAHTHRLPTETEQQRAELEIRLGLAPALAALDGYSADSLRENCERAAALCAEVGQPQEQFDVAYALCHVYAARGELATDAAAARLDAASAELGTIEARQLADSALVRMDMVAGRLSQARRRMQAAPHLRLGFAAAWRSSFGPNPVVDAHAHFAVVLWFLGDREGARKASGEAIAAARASGSPFTKASAFSLGSFLCALLEEPSPAIALADEAQVLCQSEGFSFWCALASIAKGRALVLQGSTRDGIERLTRMRDEIARLGALVLATPVAVFLADSLRRDGDVAAAVAAVDEGIAVVESSWIGLLAPELWRIKGELLQLETPTGRRAGRSVMISRPVELRPEAELCLSRALDLARQQEAPGLEQRAVDSLATVSDRDRRKARPSTDRLAGFVAAGAPGARTP